MSGDRTTAEEHGPTLSVARRHFPRIRLGTQIGKLLRRQKQEEEEEEGPVPPIEAEQQQNQPNNGQRNDANGKGTVQNENKEGELNNPKAEASAEETEAEKEEENNDEQRNNGKATEGHGTEIGKSAASHGPNADEARQKWGRRRTSVVHPLEADQPMPSLPASSLRPPSAFRFGPSSPTPWIYMQMADRSFRRTTVAQLRADHQQKDEGGGQMEATDGQLLGPEFASVTAALFVQNAFRRFALIVLGFVAGLTFGHALFAFYIADLHFLQYNAWMFEFGLNVHSFCSLPSFGILACLFAFLASISSAQIEQLLAEQTENEDPIQWDAQLLFTVWQMLSAARAVGALFGWLTMAIRPTANATHETLAKMLTALNSKP